MKQLILVIVSILLYSCNSNIVYEKTISFNNDEWKENRVAIFEVKGIDTTGRYDINIIVRNTNEYEFSSIYLISKINKSNKTVEVDTLEYLMANPDGSWLGTGNLVKESWLAYKTNYQFEQDSIYAINIVQANRKNDNVTGVKNLKGITDIGIQITKQNNTK